MPKRNATSELNHDNWNEEDAPEDAGTFQKATTDIIEKRIIRSARRRTLGGSGSASPSIFASFQGFNKPAESASPFGFFKKTTTNQDSDKQDKMEDQPKHEASNKSPSVFQAAMKEPSSSKQDPLQPTAPYTPAYIAAIKKLNECFLKHIQSSLEENHCILLSPCFRDYERHLKGISPLNDPSDSQEAQSLERDEKSETDSPQPKAPVVEMPMKNFASGGKSFFAGSLGTESSPGSGFKIFGGGESSAAPTVVSAAPTAAISPFGAAPKKQYPWMSGLGGTGTPGQPAASESVSDSPKVETAAETGEGAEESDAPPKVEFKQVVEEGAVYNRRCKVFVKKENSYHDHGVGMLYLKPVETGKKTQVIVRADTSLGNLLINTLLSADMMMQKMGSNNVMLYCIPTPDFKPPKPLPVLLRVKTSEDADELLQKLNEYKK